MNYFETAKRVLQVESKSLLDASYCIDNTEIDKAIELILKCDGKLIVTGVGKSGLVGSKIAATLASTGTSSFFLHPTEAMHGDLGMIGKNDIVLGISYSGESQELIQILPHLKRLSVPLISMANSSHSTLAKYSDAFLSINVEKEACPLDIAPTSSTTLTMAMGDALAICLMEAKSFKKEDFASFHPGGSLGKKLFIKVSDVMQTKNLPVVSRGTSLKDSIVVMSEGRIGNVLILNQSGQIQGLLSDGDLRRALMSEDFNINDSIEKVATKDPFVVTDDKLLASDALKIIEDKKIQLLIIADTDEKLKGVIHIHDLVEAGIK